MIARLRSKPVIVNYRGGAAERFLERQHRIVVPVLRAATLIVVPSTFLRDVFSQYGIETTLIPNAVDSRRFHPGDYAAIRARRTAILVTTRNLEPIYDLATAINAFATVHRAHPSSQLRIAGDGPERPRLEALVRDLGLADAVTFMGRIAVDDLAALLRDATLLLNSSRVDNMPNSLLEALASGVPLVSTNSGGIPRIIDDGKTGLLVAAGDADAMAGAALRILQDETLAFRLASAGCQSARRYTWETIGHEWSGIYRNAHGARIAASTRRRA
jgi:glycosyltransferase involved in cell wall biosynthesis